MDSYVEIILIALTTVLAGIISVVGERLIKYIKQKTKSERLRNALTTAADTITKVVKCTAQTFVKSLKSEGNFTKEKQMQALITACEAAKNLMSSEVKAAITEAFGNLDRWILTNVEACIYDGQAPKSCENKAAEE
jgi:hypothetical protein